MDQGQHLGLIKNNDAVGQIVELPALGGAAGVDGFKQLHRRGHHHRHVPVLRGQSPACFLRRRAVREVEGHIGVVLQHVAVAQNIPEYLGVLLDDGGIGNNVDHPPHPVGHDVAQGKGQGCHSLPATGGNRQGVYALGLVAGLQAGVQNFAAQAVQFRFRILPWRDMGFQPGQKRFHIIVPAPAPVSVHECFGIQKVRVHQAGIEHPCPEGRLQITFDWGNGP